MLAVSPKIGEQFVLPDYGTSAKTIRILIADHDEALLACYREFLEAEGLRVRTATRAVGFLTKLHSWLPDIIVLEPHLSGGASRRAAIALRRCTHVPPIPVLIHGSRADALAPLEFPICGYEVRPLRPEQLANRVREVLQQFRSRSVRRGRESGNLSAKAAKR